MFLYSQKESGSVSEKDGYQSPIRLLVLAEDFYPNVSGGAHARFRFCQLAVERGHDITVFTPRRPDTPKREVINGVEIRRPFPAKPSDMPAYTPFALTTRTLYSIVLFGYLLRWLRGESFDGINSVSHSMHWVGKLLSILYSLPLVTFIGYSPSANGTFRWQPNFIRERINFRLFMGSVVFCRTHEVASVVREASGSETIVLEGILNTERIREIAERTDFESVRVRLGFNSGDKLLVFLGRLVPIKNPIGALESLEALPADYNIVMVGGGPEKERVKNYVERNDLSGRVIITGKVPHKEALEYLGAGDCLVLPSDEEACPTAVFEALALRKHVVATPVGMLSEMDHDRLHLGPVTTFPSAVQALDFSAQSRLDDWILDRYSMERYTDAILESFESLLKRDGIAKELGPNHATEEI